MKGYRDSGGWVELDYYPTIIHHLRSGDQQTGFLKKLAKAIAADTLSHETLGLAGQPIHDVHKKVEFAPGDRVVHIKDNRVGTIEGGFDDMGYPTYWVRYDDNPNERAVVHGWWWGKPTLSLLEKSGNPIPETSVLRSELSIRFGVGPAPTPSIPVETAKIEAEKEDPNDPIEAILARARKKGYQP